MEGLGRLFDLGTAFAPVDSQTAAITAKRVALRDASGITFVLFKGAGTGTDHPVLTVNQHTAYTGGTTGVLATIDHYYAKSEAALDNDETWARITSGIAAGVITTALATSQAIIAVEIDAKTLTDGYTHVSVDLADTGAAGAQLVAGLYILHGLKAERAPTSLGNLLNPGAANA